MQLEYYTQIREQWNETINQAVARGITWVQAAGNDGEKRWKSMFTDTDGDGYLNFTSDRNYNEIELPSGFSYGKEVYVLLAWGGDQDSTTDDFNLFITDSNGKIVADSTISQAEIPEFPMEVCKFTPVPGKKYFAKVQNYNALPQVVTLNIGADIFAKFNICLPSGTVKMNPPADNPNVITVGAVSYTSPNTIETYSSQGPNADDVIKPDFVAPDGVSTSTYGSNGFSGTSSAAPYVAGVSALVKQAHPDYTSAQIRSYLELYALDLGTPGKDNIFGSGLVQLPESECISVSDDLKLNLCVDYQNEDFTASLAYAPVASDPSGIYWKLNPSSLVRTTNGANCLAVADDLNLSLCAQYRNVTYEFALDYVPALSTGTEIYWKIDTSSFRQKD
jgi:subtilisin family serine protease